MAPEQARRGRADARTDIFALGAVMFEMASGRKALEGDRPAPALAGSNAVLNGVIGRCLKIAPVERWQSAAELIGELKRIGMGGRWKIRAWMAVVAAVAVLVAGVWVFRATRPATAAVEQVLYSFTGRDGDGAHAAAAVARGENGHLYGTNSHGGRFGKGAIYELRPTGPAGVGHEAQWTEIVIYSFTGGSDGNDPFAMLTAGEHGELYGVTQRGGSFGKGTVFQLAPGASGAWIQRVVHQFAGRPDGINPRPDLILGKNGALYGTTADGGLPGGDEGFGTVFELAPPSTPGGEWKEQVLYRFTGANGDGANPFGNVVWGADGSLYGTTFGGPTGPGSVYRLSPPADPEGAWTETVLRRFALNSDEGRSPVGDLAMGADGTVYGTAQWGGISENGVVFSLQRPESGVGDWKFTVLHRFTSHIGDAAEPTSGVLIGADGSLYGTTVKGGTWGNGAVYRLTPGRGQWTETVLYSFTGQQGDGAGPQCIGRLLLEGRALYGTTEVGGRFNLGTVFKLTLPR
jgi:uncharacterized repeat protein (TIGR03803 family)